MGDVVHLDMVTQADIDPKRILEGALAAELESVVVIGFKGKKLHFAMSDCEIPEILYAIKRAEYELMMNDVESHRE